ncbi:family 16 glycosylhydrolase [bacterium]|nr:family 16 glycosylhydrolase [bacterium]
MQKTIFFTCLLLLACTSSFAEEWKLTWAEEFEKPGLANPTSWSYEVGKIRNHEAQYYTKARKENALVEDGCLVITSRKEKYKGANYTSASLHTKNKVHFLYGRIEVRAKIPTGRGMWPAIWMLGTNIGQVGWPECGEIDILENVGYDPNIIHANVHSEAFNHTKGNGRGDKIEAEAPYKDFHIYAIEWHPDKIDFFFDQKKYFTVKDNGGGKPSWPFDAEHYLILNAAIGGSWGGKKGIDDSIFPQQYKIDYVRVYKKVAGNDEIGSVRKIDK